MIKELDAYQFEADLLLADIQVRWNQLGPWEWVVRDKDSWGDYLFALPLRPKHGGNLKLIVVEKFKFVINIKLTSESDDAQEDFNSVRRILLEQLLPAIDARNLTPVEYYE